MAFQHQAQSSRYELKYLLSELTARRVREFVLGYLEPDDFTNLSPSNGSIIDPISLGYGVHSLYLDSPSTALYSAVMQGSKNRFKLRMRFYDDKPESPVFLEIKRRTNDTIQKERAAVSRECAEEILQTSWSDPKRLMFPSAKALDAHRHFCELCQHLDAQGRTLVCYQREAYMPADSDEVRVTFDRKIFGVPYQKNQGLSIPFQGIPTKVTQVVLELKFTNRFPQWMNELAQLFNLERCSVPKYVECFDVVEGKWFVAADGSLERRWGTYS